MLIIGVAGACRRQELVSLSTKCVEDYTNHFIVKLVDTKTKRDRSFMIVPGNLDLLNIIRSYIALRPSKINHDRFFINYIKGKCTVQPVGIHKVAAVPSIVAKFLKLENYQSYTGHCFRRTSASMLAASGASMESIKRHGGWRSSTVAEGYIDESSTTKKNVADKILSNNILIENNIGNLQTPKNLNISSDMSLQNPSGMSVFNNQNCVINIHNHYRND